MTGRCGQGLVNRAKAEPGCYCVCPNCGEKTAFKTKIPCSTIRCPKCKSQLVRK